MRRLLHAVLSWCRQRPAIALVPLVFLLYCPCLLAWPHCPLMQTWTEAMAPSPQVARLNTGLGLSLSRLHSLLWLFATIGAARLALRYSCDLGERNTSWVATMSLFIYATTSTSSTTLFFAEQRPILISACFSWLSLAALAARAQGSSSISSLLSWASLAIALRFGLSGLCGAAFVLAYVALGDPRSAKARLKSSLGHLALTLGAGYRLLQELDPQCQAQGMLGRFAHLCAQALAWLLPEPARCIESRSLVIALGFASLAAATIALRWVLKTASPNHVRTLRWTSAGALLSLIPLLMQPADPRYLWFASLGTSVLFASLLRRCAQVRRTQRICALLLGLGTLRHFILAPVYTFLFTLLLATKGPTPPKGPKAHPECSESGARAENAYLAVLGPRHDPQLAGHTGYHRGYAEPRSPLLAARPHSRRRR